MCWYICLICLINKRSILRAIDSNQYGFKPLSSTTCALLDITEYITKCLDTSSVKSVAMITFDFSKAFDKINYSLLLKYSSMKILIWNFTSGSPHILIKQRVRINGTYSDITNITSGVPQGLYFGPTFILFIHFRFTMPKGQLCKTCKMRRKNQFIISNKRF